MGAYSLLVSENILEVVIFVNGDKPKFFHNVTDMLVTETWSNINFSAVLTRAC